MSLGEVVTEFYPLLIPGVLALMVLPAITFVEEHRRRRRKVRCLAWDWWLTSRQIGSLEQQAVFSFEAYLLNPRPFPMKLHSTSHGVAPRQRAGVEEPPQALGLGQAARSAGATTLAGGVRKRVRPL
jgi:hypothetical protein